jgi:hypothetical protein
VEDSWLVLSLESKEKSESELSEIALFIASGELDSVVEPPAPKPLVTIVDMGESYEAKMLDTSFEMIDNYLEEQTVSSEPLQQQQVETPQSIPQIENISVRVFKEGDVMRFSNSKLDSKAQPDAELVQLRAEVLRLSGETLLLFCFFLIFETTEQLNRMTDLQGQIDMLKSVFASARVGDSFLASPAQRVVHFDVSENSEQTSLAAPPPPPPPPPQTFEKSAAKKKRVTPSAPIVAELTEEQIDQILRSEIGLSGKTAVAVKAAIENFLRAFAKPEHRVLLRKLATDYPFLVRTLVAFFFLIFCSHFVCKIRALPLQPLDCVKKMAAWEKLMFKDMDAVSATNLRRRKQIEIVTLDPTAVESEVEKIKKAEIVRIQKEKEALEASKIKVKQKAVLLVLF